MRYLVLLLIAALINPLSYSQDKNNDSSELEKEVKKLSIDVEHLEKRLNNFKLSVNERGALILKEELWVCFLDDPWVELIHSHAQTEVQAKAKVLSICKSKRGVCFESRVECGESTDIEN